MNMKNDYRTPRERVDEDLLRRLLLEDGADDGEARPTAAIPVGRTEGCCGAREKTCEKEVRRKSYICADVPLAMVYSPYQTFSALYDPEDGLSRGTVFAELEKPFYPTPCGAFAPGCPGMQKEGW